MKKATTARKTAICIGAHPDDIEFSMGGTLAKLAAAGWHVLILDITNGEPTPHGSPEIRAKESKAAAAKLSVKRKTLSYENRFLFDSVEARKEIASEIRKLKPQIMFVHYPIDAHPDHWAAHSLGMAARFYGKLSKINLEADRHYAPRLFYFFSVHLKIAPQPSFCVDISDYINTKIDAVSCYQSQFKEVKLKYKMNKKTNNESEHNQVIKNYVEGHSRYWGMKINCAHAEPFYSPEILAISDFSTLL